MMTKIKFKYSNYFNKEKSSQEKVSLAKCSSKDLENLRAAANREISQAVYTYFIASREVLNEPFEDMTYQEYFAQEAADEMLHYLEIMNMISKLDPIQKKQFMEHDLTPYFVKGEYPPITFWYGPYCYYQKEREERWLKTTKYVIEAISLELETISYYEKYIEETNNREVKTLFTKIMNHEKGDIADFNQMLLTLYSTPNKQDLIKPQII